ncbi:MAG: metallophosphoesterase [Clostridium sp.]|uniref:metallophosphoesterase n=1 Tax=Clostridium sp. TaxID=1506 RepID=UPI0025C588B1|nr:metallophosphoesterase [Clostridium sp.]MCH3962752.1 metallophosphoesterase [Clostridium sp.]MCI1715833.1 metallophosphoesterase [Clostridium sp.]MCI1799962.1 metallophosphoesterase [Clostridium sp.]MCI1813876.1 metallophosphoesterase [Clostridium sp.]MCI1870774.1 metallophosphoesterase [Clostridium sp.]
MRIGVISDTHRYAEIIKKAIKVFDNPDLVIHLGDNVQDVNIIEKLYRGRIINVSGNCDFSTHIPSERLEIIENKKFFLTHGHKYDVKYDISRLKYRAMELNADVVLFGHTHISKIAYDNGIWFINPGSPYLSRDGVNSVATIDIEGGIINASIRKV